MFTSTAGNAQKASGIEELDASQAGAANTQYPRAVFPFGFQIN